jgi:sulfite exporter TauE/SafE
MPEANLFSIFLVGLLGGTHCAGMCGGIVAAVSLQLPGDKTQFPFHLAYNLGRIASYAVAGLLAGMLGAGTLLFADILPMQRVLYGLANLMLIALGLYLAGIWYGVRYVEKAGNLLWKNLQPFLRRLLPIHTLPGAFAVGAVWGWLPCGLVYSVLVSALASGSARQGGLLMLAFGLGTLPNLLAMGLFAQQLRSILQQRWMRRTAGLLVMGFGVLGLIRLYG